MAENVLSDADDAAMIDRFTEVEDEKRLAGLYEQYESDVARWEEAMGKVE